MIMLFATGLVIIADQISKYLIRSQMEVFESIPVIQNFFHITYVTNNGMAFGINFPGGFFIFTGASMLMTLILFYYLWTERNGHIFLRLALALILGGALGNLIDRLYFGSVVDFLDFIFGSYHWYIFNVADSAVTVGMGIYLVFILFVDSKRTPVTAD